MHIHNTYASAAADLTGFASNVTGAAFTLTATNSGDSMAHKVTVRNDSVTDHSGKTLALVGTDYSGAAQTETLTAPGTSATVTSTKYWKTLTSITPSATIGADTFDIGWAAASVSPPINMRDKPTTNNSVIGFSCDITGSPTYTVQQSFGGEWYDNATVAAETTSQQGAITFPIMAMRVAFAAAGTVDIHIMHNG